MFDHLEPYAFSLSRFPAQKSGLDGSIHRSGNARVAIWKECRPGACLKPRFAGLRLSLLPPPHYKARVGV